MLTGGSPYIIISQPRCRHVASRPCRSLVACFLQYGVSSLASSWRLSLASHSEPRIGQLIYNSLFSFSFPFRCKRQLVEGVIVIINTVVYAFINYPTQFSPENQAAAFTRFTHAIKDERFCFRPANLSDWCCIYFIHPPYSSYSPSSSLAVPSRNSATALPFPLSLVPFNPWLPPSSSSASTP